MNKGIFAASALAGLASGTAVWFLYDPAARLAGKVRARLGKRHDGAEEAEVESIFEPDAEVNVGEPPEKEPMDFGYSAVEYTAYSALTRLYSGEAKASADESPTEYPTVTDTDLDAFMDIDEGKRHVCTWYRKDKVLAGMDDDLEMMDVLETFGHEGERLLDECELDSLYLIRLDDQEAFEIVLSDDNYETEYAEYQVMRESMGSQAYPKEE